MSPNAKPNLTLGHKRGKPGVWRMPMKSALVEIFLVATLLTAHPVGAESPMPQELICRLPADTGAVDPAVLLAFCKNLSQRLNATLLLDQAPELGAKSLDRTIFVLDISVKSDSALKLAYAFGSTEAWQTGAEIRYDDLGFDVMDAGIDATTIGRLADTLVGLSAARD